MKFKLTFILFLACFCAVAEVPPLPVKPKLTRAQALRKVKLAKVAMNTHELLNVPRMAITAPVQPQLTTNIIAADFLPTQIIGLMGFFEVNTNLRSTNWTRLRTFQYPANGATMFATNTIPVGMLCRVQAGYTFPK